MNQVVNDVSLEPANGMVNLDDALHVYMVQEKLKQFIDPTLVEKVLYEKGNKKELSKKDKETIKDLQYIKGSDPAAYSKDGKLPAVWINDDGKLVKPEKEKGEDEDGTANPMYTGDEPGVEPPKGEEEATHNTDYDPDNADWEPESNYDHKAVAKLSDKLEEKLGQIPFEKGSNDK